MHGHRLGVIFKWMDAPRTRAACAHGVASFHKKLVAVLVSTATGDLYRKHLSRHFIATSRDNLVHYA